MTTNEVTAAVEATEQFVVRNRWNDRIQFTAEITCRPDASVSLKLGLAVKWAYRTGASLVGASLVGARLDGASLDGARLDGASLDGASLDGARLVGARLDGASLVGASLDGASLDGASLDGASLDGARLVGARLVGASLDGARLDGASLVGASLDGARLDGASLDGASLDGASLVGARLVGASLDGASLDGARLDGASLDGARLDGASLVGASLDGASLPDEVIRSFKADLFLTLSSLRAGPLEAIHLVQKLRAGEVDGSTYGESGNVCACLVGTIAKARNVDCGTLDRSGTRPAERWFMMIRPGDKAGAVGEDGKETGGGFAARKALEWVIDWCASLGFDPDTYVVEPAPEVAL